MFVTCASFNTQRPYNRKSCVAFVVLLICHPSLKKEGLDEVYGNKPYFCPVTKSGDGVSWLWQIF
jgi:hypothetical protein